MSPNKWRFRLESPSGDWHPGWTLRHYKLTKNRGDLTFFASWERCFFGAMGCFTSFFLFVLPYLFSLTMEGIVIVFVHHMNLISFSGSAACNCHST